jgi:hypothetical protein
MAISLSELQTIAKSIAASRMFGVDTEDQAMALMLLCQAEGIHPVMALRRYHIIEGKPAYRADALQGEFGREGEILWHERTDDECSATFFRDKTKVDRGAIERARTRYELLKGDKPVAHLATPGEITIVRTLKDAIEKKVALTWSKEKQEYVLKKNWKSSPRQMLHARCLTEGVRAINPGLVAGIYSEDEIHDAVMVEAEDVDQRLPEERVDMTERNVREATAHATGEDVSPEATHTDEPTNEYGPLSITKDNYKQLISHFGKAGGRILGLKVGEMPRNVILWMLDKWVASLNPSASEQDMRLKKAIELAKDDVETKPSEHAAKPSEPSMTPTRAEAILSGKDEVKDIGARQAWINDLHGRLEDMVLTEEQGLAELAKLGISDRVSNQAWTSLDQLPDSMLAFLCLPKTWKAFRDKYEQDSRPKVMPKVAKKSTRRRT